MKFDPQKDIPKGFELAGMLSIEGEELEVLKALQNSWEDAKKRLNDTVQRIEELQILANETSMAFNGRVIELKWKLFGYSPMSVVFDEEKGALFALKESGSKTST